MRSVRWGSLVSSLPRPAAGGLSRCAVPPDTLTGRGARGLIGANALAEAVNSLYKTELIRQQGPWRGVDDVELATLGWVHWFNTGRLHGTLDDIPPAEFEAAYNHQQETSQSVGIQ